MQDAATAVKPRDGYRPSLKTGAYWTRQGADEWRLSSMYERDDSDPSIARYVVDVRVNVDGRGHLFCGRAGENRKTRADEAGPLILYESIIAGTFAEFLAAMGALYRAGGYYGHMDAGMIATGLRGGFSATMLNRTFVLFDEHAAYNADTYPRHERVAAAELDQPEKAARRLLRHLLEALTGREDFDPFA